MAKLKEHKVLKAILAFLNVPSSEIDKLIEKKVILIFLLFFPLY